MVDLACFAHELHPPLLAFGNQDNVAGLAMVCYGFVGREAENTNIVMGEVLSRVIVGMRHFRARSTSKRAGTR